MLSYYFFLYFYPERHCPLVEGRTQNGHVFQATIFPKQLVHHDSTRQESLNTVVRELTVLGLSHVLREISDITRQVVLQAIFIVI